MGKVFSANGWFFAFIAAVLAFEVCRELLVIESATDPQLLVTKNIAQVSGLTLLEGRWRRTDGGERLSPNLVSIECDETAQSCLVTDVVLFDGSIMPPDTAEHSASFSESLVSFSHTTGCVRYTVSIDADAKRAIQTRQKLSASERNELSNCDLLEDTIEMELTDGWDADLGDNEFPEGFFPILRFVAWLVR